MLTWEDRLTSFRIQVKTIWISISLYFFAFAGIYRVWVDWSFAKWNYFSLESKTVWNSATKWRRKSKEDFKSSSVDASMVIFSRQSFSTMFSQLFLSTLKHVSMVTILEFISFLEYFLEVLFFILWLVILVCFSGLKEIVMLWNVLCMKIYEIKLSLFFRVQAIIILFDHQHVDIMFVCFFQITMMMTMTKQKFLKGAKFLSFPLKLNSMFSKIG